MLPELAWLFFRLGATGLGGPAAHIAMMEDEVVGRRRWLTREQFLDFLGAANLIPGPNSTEMAIHIGYLRAGWPGLIVAGACFIVPAVILVTCIAWAYVRFGSLPQVSAILYGVKPVVIAIVAQAMWHLARTAVKTKALGLIGAASAGCALAGIGALPILAAAGAVAGFREWLWQGQRRIATAPALAGIATAVLLAQSAPAAVSSHQPAAPGTSALFLYFLKVGSVLYGSGYVLLAFLQRDLVGQWRWLTSRQLLDAVAVGQITPGPVFTTATFVGYILTGLPGAFAATAGIFLPSFFFCAISGPLVPRLRRSRVAGAFLDGVNVASLALMAAVAWELGRAALVDVFTVLTALASALVLFRYRVNSVWLILGGALLALALSWRSL
jgi:chromate transporter